MLHIGNRPLPALPPRPAPTQPAAPTEQAPAAAPPAENVANANPELLLATKDLVGNSSTLPPPATPSPTLLTVVDPSRQTPAAPQQLFRLDLSPEGLYSLQATVPSDIPTPLADGPFLFVVRPEAPDCIICGVPPNAKQALDEPRLGISGHTGITRREPVLYAGTMILRDGRLASWNNDSGHYRPPGEAAATNLSAAAKQILPMAKFQNVDELRFAEQMALLVERGYTFMDLEEPASPEPPSKPQLSPEIRAEDLAALSLAARNYTSMD